MISKSRLKKKALSSTFQTDEIYGSEEEEGREKALCWLLYIKMVCKKSLFQ